MNIRFQNLLGAPYRGGDAVITVNNELRSPVGNRVSVTDFIKSKTKLYLSNHLLTSAESLSSPDGVFLVTVDENRRCLFINLRRRVVLRRMTFKSTMNFVKFSPNGSYIAVATDWNYLLAWSKDLIARLFYMKKDKLGQFRSKPFLFHRDSSCGCVFGFGKKQTNKVSKVYTITCDCFLFSWTYNRDNEVKLDNMDDENSEPPSPGTSDRRGETNLEMNRESQVKKRKDYDGKDGEFDEYGGGYLLSGNWELSKKNNFMQAPSKLTACDYNGDLDVVVFGFSNGVFGLYQMPVFVCILLLSISREKITTVIFNELGNWLIFGSAKLGQLLVWEWQSESYILKQKDITLR